MTFRRNESPKLDRRGLTLVELMMAIAIFGVVMTAVMAFVIQSRRSYDDTRDRVRYQQGLRAVVSMMTREIRSTGCDPLDVGFDEFTFATGTGFGCRMDLNGDGDAMDNSPDETIAYAYNAATGELLRNNGVATMTILRDVTNLQFRYFDENGAELLNIPLNAVDRGRILTIDITIAGETESGEPVDLSSRIALRNI